MSLGAFIIFNRLMFRANLRIIFDTKEECEEKVVNLQQIIKINEKATKNRRNQSLPIKES